MSFEDDPRPSPDHPLAAPVLGRLRPWIEWFGAARLAVTVVGVLAAVAGAWWLLRTPSPPTEAQLPHASTSVGTTVPVIAAPVSTAPATIVVHVAGAVASPGVYELPGRARVHQAIDAAGGALAEAAPGALNLAAALADGARVYVPAVGEAVPADVPPPPAGSAAPPGPVDVNRATADELDALPGVGPATARAIVDHRAANGPFASVDDLEAVRGIGPAKLEAIRPLVTV